jgi:DNA-binding transcriptional ArsR family regulator
MPDVAPDLDRTFAALSDGTRRAIVARLAEGEAPLSDLAEPFAMSLTAVSKHVRVLSEAGLVRVDKRGRTRFCALEPAPMQAAAAWIEDYRRFWEDSFEALARHLNEEDGR